MYMIAIRWTVRLSHRLRPRTGPESSHQRAKASGQCRSLHTGKINSVLGASGRFRRWWANEVHEQEIDLDLVRVAAPCLRIDSNASVSSGNPDERPAFTWSGLTAECLLGCRSTGFSAAGRRKRREQTLHSSPRLRL